MAQTFEELGIPFPLFKGPVSDASGYAGVRACAACSSERHAFRVGNDDLVTTCPHCGTETAVHIANGNTPCFSCRQPVALGRTAAGEWFICYGCLRAGKAALTKDTVFGLIRWEDAMLGRARDVPGPAASDAHRVFAVGRSATATVDAAAPSRHPDEPWRLTKELPRDVMLELLRTPGYSTWQGEQWQFDGDQPMVYVGTWGRAEFDAHAHDGDGEPLCRQLLDRPPRGDWADWLGERSGDHGITVYVFRSQDGTRLAAHYDMD